MASTVIELVTSPGNSRVVCNLLADQIRTAPVQASEAEVFMGICRDEPRILVLIAVWPSLTAAERFEREVWPQVAAALRPFLDTPPRVRTFSCQAVMALPHARVNSQHVPTERNVQAA